MTYCIASTGDGHEAVEEINGLNYCKEHGDRFRRIDTRPRNLDRLVRKIRRRTHTQRLKMMGRLTEEERIWVSRALAGGGD